ncbi:MAG: tetratricopeptide repeat protein [Dysgonamonadaceae bacterium]|jgi:tetratricopeptide (TPR) repeat protein|nr:tetratricopeptide repeat protein [Dysgonamonadaceae bacterium]
MKISAAVCLFLILSVPAFGQSPRVQELLDSSFVYLDRNQLDSAELYLKKTLRAEPDSPINPFLMNNLGTIQRRLGKKDEALQAYTAALAQYPKNPTFLESRASLFAEIGQPGNAIIDYTTLLDERPDDAEALYQRGLLYLQMKNSDLAEADFNRMLTLNPDGYYARLGFASLYKIRGDYAESEKIYNYLIDKEPMRPETYAGRAELYLLLDKPGKASADATNAIRLAGSGNTNPYYYVIRYRAKLLLHEEKSAMQDLEKARGMGYTLYFPL